MSLIKNVGIGKDVFNFFRYIDYDNFVYNREKLDKLQTIWENLGILPNEEELLHIIQGELLYPSDEYDVWLEGTWNKFIKVCITYKTIKGQLYDMVVVRIEGGNQLMCPCITYDYRMQAWANRLVNMNIGYRQIDSENKLVFDS